MISRKKCGEDALFAIPNGINFRYHVAIVEKMSLGIKTALFLYTQTA